MRVRDWPATTTINSSDSFIIDTGSGTKSVSFSTLRSKTVEGISTDTGGDSGGGSSAPSNVAAFVTAQGAYPGGNTEWEGYRLWSNGILEMWTGGKTTHTNPDNYGYAEHYIQYPWRFDSAPTGIVFATADSTHDSHAANGGSSKQGISWGVMSETNKSPNRTEYHSVYVIGKCSSAAPS